MTKISYPNPKDPWSGKYIEVEVPTSGGIQDDKDLWRMKKYLGSIFKVLHSRTIQKYYKCEISIPPLKKHSDDLVSRYYEAERRKAYKHIHPQYVACIPG